MPINLGSALGPSWLSHAVGQAAAPVNLLTGLSWIQGTNTMMSIAGGRVRAANLSGNPRVYKTVTGLTIGATYHLGGNVYAGTNSGDIFFRVSSTVDLPDGNQYTKNSTLSYLVNANFVALTATLYLGIVVVTGAAGQYAEIDDAFTLVQV